MATWQEDLHPRTQKGDPFGGRFVAKGVTAFTPDEFIGNVAKSGGWEIDEKEQKYIDTFAHYLTPQQATEAVRDGKLADGIDEVTHDAKASLQYYCGPGYKEINRSLRAGESLYGTTVGKIIEDLTDLMSGTSLSENVALYRELSPEAADKIAGMQPRDRFTDAGFMSTSAVNWQKKLGSVIKILAPAGTRAAIIENSFSESTQAETEVILDRNTTLVYIGEQDGIKVFEVAQLNDSAYNDPTPPVIHRDKLPYSDKAPTEKGWEPSTLKKGEMPLYVRFGDFPKSGKSKIWHAPNWMMLGMVGQELPGVSAFKVIYNKQRNLWELDDYELTESGIASFDELVANQDTWDNKFVSGGHKDVVGPDGKRADDWSPPVYKWEKVPPEDIRPIYLVTGEEADDEGSDGEPLLNKGVILDRLNVQDLFHDGYFDPDTDLNIESHPEAFANGEEIAAKMHVRSDARDAKNAQKWLAKKKQEVKHG